MLSKLVETLIALIVLIPLFWILNKVRFRSATDTIRYFFFAAYLSAIYLFVGLPTLQFMRFELSLTPIPFLPMIADIRNTFLNILLFIPLGFLLPFLWKKYQSLRTTILFGFALSLSIELLQILTYRATDINDIIANTFGAALGYFIFRITASNVPPVAKFAKEKAEMRIVVLTVFLTMFFIQPYLATLYYQIAR